MRKSLKLIIAYSMYLIVVSMLVGGALSIKNTLHESKASRLTHGPVATEVQSAAFKQNVNKIPEQNSSNNHINNPIQNKNKNLNNNFSNDGAKYVILTFDDGWSSQYEAFKKITPWKGTLYISSALIGQKDRLSLENIKELYRNGWDISNHTVHHTNLTTLSLSQAYAEVEECSSWIAKQGFTRDMAYKHFAYPEGGYNDQIISILSKQNILTARTTNAGNDTSDFLQLGRTSLSGMSPKSIRNNILSDKKLLILSFHRIVPDSSIENKEIDLKESYFQEVINAIHDSKRKVITITEWYKLNQL